MSFEEEFDKIIRQKASEADFPFDEKNWEKMGAALDADRKSVALMGSRKFYVVGLLFLICSVAGFVLYMDFKPKNDDGIPGKELGSATIKNAGSEVVRSKASISKQQTIGSENLSEQEVAVTESQKANNSPAKQIASNGLAKQNKAGATANNNGERLTATVIVNRKAGRLHKTGSNREEGRAVANLNKSNKNKAVVSGTNDKVNEQTAGMENNADKSENKADLKNAAVSGLLAGNLQEQSPSANDTSASAVDLTPQQHSTNDGVVNIVEPITTLVTQFPDQASENNLLPTQFFMLKYFDDDYYKPKNIKKHFLNVETGTTYLTGWDVNKGKDGEGFNWFGGINYGLYLSKKMTIGLGAQLYNITNIETPFYARKQTEYGFGAVVSNTVITSHSLYYAAVPVRFSYIIDSQSQFGVGFNMGMLMSSNNNVETFTISENGKTNVVNQKKMTAYNTIASTSMLASVFYKTKLSKQFSLNGELIYGLNDLFKNTSTIKNNEKAVGLRVSLQYTLFDK